MEKPIEKSEDQRPSLNDVARMAGVSVATVDRTINGRQRVSATTRAKVHQAIRDLNYRNVETFLKEATRHLVRLQIIMPPMRPLEPKNFALVIDEARKQMPDVDLAIQAARIPVGIDGKQLLRAMAGIDPAKCDGVIAFLPDTIAARDAINRLVDEGVRVATIITDVPGSGRHEFVGIDNHAAGRTAASMLLKSLPALHGKILPVCDHYFMWDQTQRRAGFEAEIRKRAPRLSLLQPLETRCDLTGSGRTVSAALRRHPDIVGIYTYGGTIEGVIGAVAQHSSENRIALVSHDLTASARQWLHDGVLDAVIQQDLCGILHKTIVRMAKALTDCPADIWNAEPQVQILIAQNVDSHAKQCLPRPPL